MMTRPSLSDSHTARRAHRASFRDGELIGDVATHVASLERALADARAIAGDPRAPALVAWLDARLTSDRAALDRAQHFGEELARVEANFIAARDRLDRATAAETPGTDDADEAVRLHLATVAATSAYRVQEGRLAAAQMPARIPEVGLPRESRDRMTAEIARIGRDHGIALDGSSHRPHIDAVEMARVQARSATPAEALWWPLLEFRVLRDAPDKDRADLRALYTYRQAEYDRAQRGGAR